MRRLAFLTMSDRVGWVIDDDLAHAPLRDLGWSVDEVPWDRPDVDWSHWELVVIRSPWNYHQDPIGFLHVLDRIEGSSARLENPLRLVRPNLEKTYLRDLEARGVPTSPTVWREHLRPGDLAGLFDALDTDDIVVKPVVSASAKGAYRLARATAQGQAAEVEAFYARRPLLAQPLARRVLTEGEYSAFYFNGEYSHTVQKQPKAGDFRVQEELGGIIRAVEAPAGLREAAERTLATLDEVPLYARCDFVRSDQGDEFWLMELELVEPSLYLRTDPAAAARFAQAITDRMP